MVQRAVGVSLCTGLTARTLQTISLVQLEREKTQEVEMIFGGEEGRKLVLLLCITGTAEQARLHRTEIKLLDQFVGCLNLTVKKAQGLPKLSGKLYCHIIDLSITTYLLLSVLIIYLSNKLIMEVKLSKYCPFVDTQVFLY